MHLHPTPARTGLRAAPYSRLSVSRRPPTQLSNIALRLHRPRASGRQYTYKLHMMLSARAPPTLFRRPFASALFACPLSLSLSSPCPRLFSPYPLTQTRHHPQHPHAAYHCHTPHRKHTHTKPKHRGVKNRHHGKSPSPPCCSSMTSLPSFFTSSQRADRPLRSAAARIHEARRARGVRLRVLRIGGSDVGLVAVRVGVADQVVLLHLWQEALGHLMRVWDRGRGGERRRLHAAARHSVMPENRTRHSRPRQTGSERPHAMTLC